MTILHVTDFHFNLHWFDWLLNRAPGHDLVVMSGDLLDLAAATPRRQQIEWVSSWLNEFPRPLSVASGKQDLEWDPALNRWTPAYWLRAIENPNVWVDGQEFTLDGLSVLNIGATTRPKGGPADIWVVHTPPSGTAVATRPNGADAGDPELAAAARRHLPRLVLSGHVHNPVRSRDVRDGTVFLNPGHTTGAAFPNHLLIETELMRSELFTATTGQETPQTWQTLSALPVLA